MASMPKPSRLPEIRRRYTLLFRYTLASLLLGFLLKSIGIHSVVDTFLNVSLFFGVFAGLGLLLMFFLGAFNIWILLNSLHRIQFLHFLRKYSYSWALGLITPGQLGDASLTVLLKNAGVPFSSSSVSYALDKSITILLLSVIACYGATTLHPNHLTSGFFLLSVLGPGLCLLLLIFIHRMARRFPLLTGVQEWLSQALDKLSLFRSKWHAPAANALLSIVKWLLLSVIYYLAFLSFNSHVPWPEIGIIPVLSTLVGYLPISIAGIGVVECTAVYLFGLLGIESSIVLGVYVFLRVSQYALAISILCLFGIFGSGTAYMRNEKSTNASIALNNASNEIHNVVD